MAWVAKARKARGAKLVVVDPYRTGTAEQADVHLALKPGTDGALAAAVISVLLAEGYADRAYMEKYSDWDAGLEAHFAACTPAWARSEEHTSELQSLMRISYAVFCLKKKNTREPEPKPLHAAHTNNLNIVD